MSKNMHLTSSQLLATHVFSLMLNEQFPESQVVGFDLTRDDSELTSRWREQFIDFVWKAHSCHTERASVAEFRISGRIRLEREGSGWKVVFGRLTDGDLLFLYDENMNFTGTQEWTGEDLTFDLSN